MTRPPDLEGSRQRRKAADRLADCMVRARVSTVVPALDGAMNWRYVLPLILQWVSEVHSASHSALGEPPGELSTNSRPAPQPRVVILCCGRDTAVDMGTLVMKKMGS
jgi:hypothetical protein